MANTDVIHVLVIDVIFASFIMLRLTKNRKAVFIRSTDLCFILTVAYIVRNYVPGRFCGYFGWLHYKHTYGVFGVSQWYQWYINIVQGFTNGNTICTNGNVNGTIGSPNGTIGANCKPMVPLVGQWYYWLPMIPLVKLPMVRLGEPRTEP